VVPFSLLYPHTPQAHDPIGRLSYSAVARLAESRVLRDADVLSPDDKFRVSSVRSIPQTAPTTT
jgi:hypothetical protein